MVGWMNRQAERQKQIYFKELAYASVGASKSEIYSTGQQVVMSQAKAEADAAVLRQNVFFLMETPVLLLRPFN